MTQTDTSELRGMKSKTAISGVTLAQSWADEAMRLKNENMDLQAVNAQLLDPLKSALAPFDDPTRNPNGLRIGEPSWVPQARAAIKAATEG